MDGNIQELKILVSGPFHSGKSTLIRTISECGYYYFNESFSPELQGYTLGCGRIRVDETLDLLLFVAPDQYPPGFLEVFSAKDFLGSIIVIDTANSDTIRRANPCFHMVYMFTPSPVIIASNPHGEGWPVDDLRILLGIPEDAPIVSCDLRDKESSKQVVLSLLYHVLDLIETAEQA